MIPALHSPRWRWFAVLLSLAAYPACAQDEQPPPTVDVIVVDGEMCEGWPDPGVVAFRRAESDGDLTVRFKLTGTAKRGVDYEVAEGDTITIPDGRREAWLSFTPVDDGKSEGPETIIVTLQAGEGYVLAMPRTRQAATLSLANSTGRPGAKEAVRFLWQASFGPSADGYDGGIVPENAQQIMSLGIERWIDNQFRIGAGLHQPMLDTMTRYRMAVNSDAKMRPFWANAIGPRAVDPLRQRVAFALSEIFVISENVETLYRQPIGMANYYDMLVKGAFGNVRDLLFNVTMHPCMGGYLNHLKNRKFDPETGTFPDENYAREVMQLFSIGLVQLNPDGTPVLDGEGRTIPTYDNDTITSFARVFTGFSFGGTKGNKDFWWPEEDWTHPMRLWDEYHDMEPKTLLNGVVLPARTPSTPDKGTAALADVKGAIDCVFNHPNIGPFLSRQLIQRLVTSNPSPEYVGRVAAKFADNGKGVRGDMKAILKAILLDPEARSPAMLSSATYGKLREPYLRTLALARAFDSRSASGIYDVGNLNDIHFQSPYDSPSVFNFFKPNYSPPGPVNDAGLLAPEFQILNAITSFSIPNYYYSAMRNGFDRYGQARDGDLVRPQFRQEVNLAGDVPALMRRLDMVLMGGTLSAAQHQIIREAVEAIGTDQYNWRYERVYLAVYLMATLPECAIQR